MCLTRIRDFLERRLFPLPITWGMGLALKQTTRTEAGKKGEIQNAGVIHMIKMSEKDYLVAG